MTVSPDYTNFVDLTLYDKGPQDILDAAQSTLQARIPDWSPTSTNIEVMLLEALALEVSEAIFSINRVPESMIRVLLSLYGIQFNSGEPPTVNLLFTAQDNDGYIIPAGTEIAVPMSNGEYMSFFTDSLLTISQGNTTGTVGATATEFTNIANGITTGTNCELVDAIVGVESVETSSTVVDGRLPETVEEWTNRGVQRLSRLVETLVIPQHFVQAALENPLVYRANAIDNYDATADPPGDPGDHPGNITVVVYGESTALSSGEKTSLKNSLEAKAVANLVVHVIDPTITTVNVTASVGLNALAVEATVLQAIEDRLNEYLSVATWPWDATVRRNELISIIDQVPGVSYVNAITAPASDVVIDPGLTLVNAGTITITVV